MHNLPSEILHQIFILLHQQDKLECMSVCSKWRHVIESFSSLFHTVRISNEEQLCKLIDKVQQEPTHGIKVERLVFDVDCIKHYELDILPILFPNISVFIFSKTFDQCDIPLTKKLLPHPWHYNIQHIAEYLRNSHTIQTLTSSMCSQLTRLTIYGKMGQSGKGLVDLLANAPSLRSLSISFYSFTFADFEILHENVPSLSLLSMENADIICEIPPSSDIKPSASMTVFHLKPSSVYPARHEITLLQYVCKKYPNLVELSHGVYVLNEEECIEEEVLRDGYAPLMTSLGSKLKSFSLIYYDMDQYPFEEMDKAGCQVNDFTLSYVQDYAMIQLAQSNQVKYITKLTLTALSRFLTLDWLNTFVVLKELTLCFPDPGNDRINRMQKIDLNEVLGYVGNTLEMIKLGGVQLNCCNSSASSTSDDDYHYYYPLLKTMIFGNVFLPSELDQFISQSFPNLRNLAFDHCGWIEHTFILSDISLSTLKIIEDFGDLTEEEKEIVIEEDVEEKVLVKTLNNNEQRWYSARAIKNMLYYENQFDTGDLAVYPSMTSVPFDECNGNAFLTFVCNSLQNIFIVNSAI